MESLETSLAGADAVRGLRTFINDYRGKFKFSESAEARRSLATALLKFLACEDRETDDLCFALEALRILCRESTGLQPLACTDGLSQLLKLAGVLSGSQEQVASTADALAREPVERDWRTGVEATKCLCNLTYNINECAGRMVNELDVVQPLINVLGHSVAPQEALFYLTRLLFLVSGFHRASVTVIREKGGLVCLVSRLLQCVHVEKQDGKIVWVADTSLSVADRRLAAELVKVLFSLTAPDVKMTEDECSALADFFETVRLLLARPDVLEGEEGDSLRTQLVYILVNLPEECGPRFAPSTDVPESTAGVVVFEGCDVTAVSTLRDTLERQVKELGGGGSLSAKGDRLVGYISAMARCARCSRIVRRYLSKNILPTLTEVTQRPEEGSTLKARLVRLMTSAHSTVSKTTTDFLFVLCKENASRFVKHTGYGNAAGLLMQRGLLGGDITYDAAAAGYSSDSDDGLGPEQDPVTGGPPRPPTLDDMTEEEKEAEAEKLVHLFEQLERTGVVKVMTKTDGQ